MYDVAENPVRVQDFGASHSIGRVWLRSLAPSGSAATLHCRRLPPRCTADGCATLPPHAVHAVLPVECSVLSSFHS